MAPSGDTGARDESAAPSGSPVAAPTGEPLKIGFDEGFTGFMAVDAQLTDHGIKTRARLRSTTRWMGRPIEYFKADNASDPVHGGRQGHASSWRATSIQVMLGPIFSPSNAAVTDYLAKGGGGIPSISIFGQPSDNLKTANGLSFIPAGMMSQEGYLLGKYAAETLGYKTANAISLEDTTGHAAHEGLHRRRSRRAAARSSATSSCRSTRWTSARTSRPSSPPTAPTTGSSVTAPAPFIKQYHDYGLEAPLIMTMADDLQEPVMQELGDLALGIVGSDHYLSDCGQRAEQQVRRRRTTSCIRASSPTWTPTAAYTAVMMFLKAVEATGGDTSPEALKTAMSTMTFDTPNGSITMSPYDRRLHRHRPTSTSARRSWWTAITAGCPSRPTSRS